MKKFSKILFVFLVLILSFEINAQNKGAQKVIMKDGWSIPPMSRLKEESKGKLSIGNDKTLLVDAQSFSPKGEIEVELTHYFLDENNLINVRKSDDEVRNVVAYTLNGKIFAYKIEFVGIRITEQRVKSYLGCISSFFYIDEDGDGVFETRYSGLELADVPKWAKNDNQNQTGKN